MGSATSLEVYKHGMIRIDIGGGGDGGNRGDSVAIIVV